MDEFRKWLAQEKGRNNQVAKACGITHGAISQWTEIPVGRVLAIEELTGISRHVLRPDVYGPEPERAA